VRVRERGHLANRVNRRQRELESRNENLLNARPPRLKRDILVIRISRYPIMYGNVEFVTTEFDIFAHKPVQTAILETNVVHNKPIARVDQSDLEFLIPADNETHRSGH